MRVGIVGTGFAARLRAESLQEDGRATLVGISGHQTLNVNQFAADFGATPFSDWTALLHSCPLDLLFICTINRDHAQITRTALNLGLQVVVEYPLAFDLAEAHSLVALAEQRKQVLHVEHIELLSGIHLLAKRELTGLGSVFAADYTTLTSTRPAPDRWTYRPDLFGFPLVGAVSRIHRLIDLFGSVAAVSCQVRYAGSELPQRFSSCYCQAQLRFGSGLIATLAYGKGESIWRSQRTLTLHGQNGALLIDGEQAVLLRPDGAHPLEAGSRRGLFDQDTRIVLDHLLGDQPLYVNPAQMLHALEVALAAQASAAREQWVQIAPAQG